MKSPADILHNLTGIPTMVLLGIIIIYYLIATVLPIDQVIGRIYQFWNLFTDYGSGNRLWNYFQGYAVNIPEITFHNFHPAGKSIFPYLCISIACGAISGFHATQSPMMARCLRTEKEGRRVFYGAMISEGIVALVWAAAAMCYFGNIEGLAGAGRQPLWWILFQEES